MPRTARQHQDHALYHLTLRGNNAQRIFFVPEDRHCLHRLIAEGLVRYRCRLHAYCYLTNHIHLALQVSDVPLGAFVRYFATKYVKQAHRHQQTTGHLFGQRYFARLVDTDAYLLQLVRYIHLNPVRAGLVADIDLYTWSSHAVYDGRASDDSVTTDLVLRTFAADPDQARAAYRHFLSIPPDNDELARFRQSAKPNRLVTVTNPKLETLLAETAEEFGISVDELTGPSKAHHLSDARARIVRQCKTRQVASLRALARRLNRSPSTLSELLRHESEHR